jgi:hypothetical protein
VLGAVFNQNKPLASMWGSVDVLHIRPIRVSFANDPGGVLVKHILRLCAVVEVELAAHNSKCVRVDCRLLAEGHRHSAKPALLRREMLGVGLKSVRVLGRGE